MGTKYKLPHKVLNCLHCSSLITKGRSHKKYCSKKCGLAYRSKRFYESKHNDLDYFLRMLLYKSNRKEINFEFLKDLYVKQNGKCAITGEVLTWIWGKYKVKTNISIDRIDYNKGYTKDNIQLVCFIVNIMKYNMTLNELKDWCKKIT